MAVIRFACPGCQSILKSGNPIALGTKIKCPKCSHIFPLTQKDKEAALEEGPVSTLARKGAAAADYADLDDRDDEDNYEEDYDDSPQPKLKKKKRKQGSNTTLILALSIGGLVLLLAGGGLGAYFWLRTPNYQEPLAFVPANSTVIVSADVENLIDQLGVNALVEQALKQTSAEVKFADCKKETDLEFKELFSQVTFALTTPVQQMMNPAAGLNPNQKVVVVVKSKVPFDPKKVAKHLNFPDVPEKLAGKSYYKKTVTKDQLALFMPSKRLMVITNMVEKELEGILTADGNKIAPSGDMLAMITRVRSSPFWTVSLNDPNAAKNMQANLGAQMAVPGLDMNALTTAMAGAKSSAAWLDIENNQVKLTLGLMFPDPGGATRMVTELDKAWKLAKGLIGLAMFAPQMKDAPKMVKDAIDEVMKNTKVTNQETLAQISTEIGLANVKLMIQELDKAMSGSRQGFVSPGTNPVGANPGSRPRSGGRGAGAPGRPVR
jgi:hypothetical protein